MKKPVSRPDWAHSPQANVPPSSSRSRYDCTRSRWRAEISGPQTVLGLVGSPGFTGHHRNPTPTASSYLARGTTRRVVIAHPCPACMAAVNADIGARRGEIGVVETRNADLPPQLQEHLLDGRGAGASDRSPGSRGTVNDDMSTRDRRIAPTSWSLDVTMLSTRAGHRCTGRRVRRRTAAHQGYRAPVSEPAVLPAAGAGPILARLIWCGNSRRDRTDNAYRFPERRSAGRIPIGMRLEIASPRIRFGGDRRST